MLNYADFIKNNKMEHVSLFDESMDINEYDGLIVLPPPNITGNLHIGHALNAFIQDFRVRIEKTKGKNILWIPGTDHSGIATQILVEKSILPLTRMDLGREIFMDKVWEWKEKYQANIYSQLKSLNISLNWNFAKFTMDSDVQSEVYDTFYKLYHADLIYQAKKMLYWDTQLETAVSDLEVKFSTVKGKMFYIKYPLTEECNGQHFITVATTRPETMFGDKAIAVNPSDDRYRDLVGKKVCIPMTNIEIPIITDERCEISKGTGAVKVTPGHDFLDFDIGKDNSLQSVDILDSSGRLSGKFVPKEYVGLSSIDAREKLETDLMNFIDHIEDVEHQVPLGERSGTVLEPKVTMQWFVDTKSMAEKALEALDRMNIFPDYFVKLYKNWMNNIQPWCISRQLWWGHRIPVWYCGDNIIVARSQEEAQQKAIENNLVHYTLKQDEDVLDTWFSSALWPFVTVTTNDLPLNKFYPNEFLVTGHDILFFWVARMVMLGGFVKGGIPFKEVYLHGLVQDDFGKKMSKSKNNVVDPMKIVDEEGSDVLRFALLYHSVPGKNIKFGDKNIEHARHFCIKIWNLYNFIKHNVDGTVYTKVDLSSIEHDWNKWILSELQTCSAEINDCVQNWEIHRASSIIYHFTWDVLCNWYLEGAKFLLKSDFQEETIKTLCVVMKNLATILYPFIPILSSFIHRDLFGKNIDKMEMLLCPDFNYDKILFVKSVIEAVRFCKTVVTFSSIRYSSEKNYQDMYGLIEKISGISVISEHVDGFDYPIHDGFITIVVNEDAIDLLKEKIIKKYSELSEDYKRLLARQNSDEFIQNAPRSVLHDVSNRLIFLENEINKIKKIMKMWDN
ncbi:MAG: valine--tRNA ligase [Alphaproteobacteria bacterium]|nr:MAG: valine--tRNA ligase [Alphaproteobacteria bacterium]